MRAAIVLALLLRATCAQAAVAHVGTSGNGSCGAGFFGNISSACVSTATQTFTYTATNTNDAVLFSLACASNPNTPSAIALTASGWSTTQVGTIVGGATQGWAAMFKAYSPNTSAATFTMTWTVVGNSCNGFMNDLIDEFSGADLTNFVDASVQNTAASGSGCPSATAGNGVTPTVNDDGIWFACNDNATVVSGGYTKGGDDNQNDWTEWKILTGGSGTEQFSSFTTSNGWTMNGVAIKPAGAATSPPQRMLLGVGKAAS